MQIRVKPEVVASSNGFDCIGRQTTYLEMTRKISLAHGHYATKGRVVYVAEKHRRTKVEEKVYTRTGKLSTKTKTKLIPTHWKFRVYLIPKEVVELLKREGKSIVQYKHHFKIVKNK